MPEDGVRSIAITGQAAQEYMGGKKKRGGTRKTIKKEQVGGEQPFSVPSGIDTKTSVATTAAPTNWTTTPLTPVPPIITPAPSMLAPHPPPLPSQQGGKQIKVELKKKVVHKPVHLQPKKPDAPKASIGKKNPTRKVRKVVLGVSSLHKRMTRAKKVHKKMKDMPLDKLKELLVSKKLIKPTSKAPESVLRQIAADSHILTDKAL